MPTATGKPTADEKREADRLASREARQSITATIEAPQWYEEQADAFVAGLAAHRAGQADGTIKSYDQYQLTYPAGAEYTVKVGRRTIKVDEGQARSYGVSDVLRERGVEHHCMQSFGLFAGRGTLEFHVTGR